MAARLETYIDRTKKDRKLTKAFYDLSLTEKFEVIVEYQERVGSLFTDRPRAIARDRDLYEKCIKAVLQHSPQKSKETYPVPGVASHTMTKKAKVGDRKEKAEKERQVNEALLDIFDQIEAALLQQDERRI